MQMKIIVNIIAGKDSVKILWVFEKSISPVSIFFKHPLFKHPLSI